MRSFFTKILHFLQINVPVDEDKGPVTVVLYNSPKFFPDEEIVEDVTYDIAQQLMNSTRVGTLFLKPH